MTIGRGNLVSMPKVGSFEWARKEAEAARAAYLKAQRDEFAMVALKGLLAYHGYRDNVAERAYAIADAMLKERAK